MENTSFSLHIRPSTQIQYLYFVCITFTIFKNVGEKPWAQTAMSLFLVKMSSLVHDLVLFPWTLQKVRMKNGHPKGLKAPVRDVHVHYVTWHP